MSVLHQIAEARASALSLRASAQACSPDQGPLKFRLMRAAEALNGMALLALGLVERVGKLEQQLRRQGGAP
jgi:hypothetical protein|nr:hypothetical protein [uncultured Steroidobacter sp.]